MGQHSHLYNTARWRRRRREQLTRCPLCVMCQQLGRVEPATVADHITPHRGNLRLFEGPLQSLCATCHSSAKQAEEHGKARGNDVSGMPLDAGHHWNR